MTATTKDLDAKLAASLKAMTIDSDGKLIQTLSLRDVFKLFEPTYSLFVSEWIDNSTINGNCKFTSVISLCFWIIELSHRQSIGVYMLNLSEHPLTC